MNLRDCLQAVADEHDGTLTPAIVLDSARPADSPLHGRFEWDDSLAGEAWRLEQAHKLIQKVKIRFTKGDDTIAKVRSWVSVSGPVGLVYRQVEQVAADEFLSELVRREMEREWQQLWTRYSHYVEFVEMVRRDAGGPPPPAAQAS